MWFLIGQVPDPITGGAGWVGAGLLGLVLGWLLLKHLPDKDRQLATIIERHLTTEEKQRHEHAEWLHRQRDDFQKMLQAMLDHNQEQIGTMTKALSADLYELREAVQSLQLVIQEKVNR